TRSPAQAPIPAITIGPGVPADIPGGAPSAKLGAAAAFAWQEFIALNWPSVAQTGAANTRDTPDTGCAFGDPRCETRWLVWETFRGKVEIFPGDASPPPGYATAPPSVAPAAWSWGYDAAPKYRYNAQFAGSVPQCDARAGIVTPTSFLNLDETDEITLNSMYSGMGPLSGNGTNSDPQLVRFLAKANRTEYVYVARHNGWWAYSAPVGPPIPGATGTPASTGQYVVQNGGDPPPNSDNYVSFPNGTIEAKAGWRLLGSGDDSRRFHTKTVRYYEPYHGNMTTPCWRQATFGLIALHIIQKTQSAPYFIYATFEQADNIRNPAGQPVERDDGSMNTVVNPCPPGQATPCPTTPGTQFVDGPTPAPSSAFPPQVVLQPAKSPYCTPSLQQRPRYQLYYLNATPPPGSGQSAVPTGGFVCVNMRAHPIPKEIVAVNDAAQSAIGTYLAQHHSAAPWAHYKLVNVQYVPIDKTSAGPYTGHDPTTGQNPASYYLANSVVETNNILQTFSGGLFGNIRSDYAYQFWLQELPTLPAPPPPTPAPPNFNATHKQVYYGGSGHDMGGCMGCHGSQGQTQGGDFSVIMARGPVQPPEVPHSAASGVGLTAAATQGRVLHNRRIVRDVQP
ncbi:MAG TPA: hypothetical protein VGN14_03665, partial [Candidatus Elarobacter sp.]